MKPSAASMSATPFYYGWLILFAAAVSELLAQGATSYGAGLFVLPLQAEFHISRTAANAPILIMFLGAALVSPFVGRMLDKYPIRLMMSGGAIIFALSFIGIAASSSLALMAALLFLPTAIGFTCIGPLTTAAMASRWFNRRRGLALGLAAVATSGGGFIVVPLLSRAIQQYGWRQGLTYEAVAIALVIIVLTFLILRDRPADMGLADHPENAARTDLPVAEAGGLLRWQDILSTRAFWIPSLVLAMVSGTSQALVVTLVPYGVSLGTTAVAAASFITAFSIAAALTKVVAGVLADRISQRLLLIVAAALMTLSWFTLWALQATQALLISACLGGIALGCALPTTAALIAGHFGPSRFGAVMGWTYTLIGTISIAATLGIGAMFDRLGGYHAAFMVLFLMLAVLLGLTLLFPLARKAE